MGDVRDVPRSRLHEAQPGSPQAVGTMTDSRLVRTKGGTVIHLRTCRYAVNFAPWLWAEERSNAEIRMRAVPLGVRPCKVCRPLDGESE